VAVDQHALASTLQTLLRTLDLAPGSDERTLVEHLDRVIEVAKPVLRVDGVGLLLLDEHDRLSQVGASDVASAALERAQQQLNIGPAIDCVRSGATVMVTDLAERPDYAALWHWLTGEACSSAPPEGAAPARAVLSAPLRVRGSVTGTLNALFQHPQSWTGDQVHAVEAYANIIGVLLRLGSTPTTRRE
jgi:GAF domain-containing protein